MEMELKHMRLILSLIKRNKRKDVHEIASEMIHRQLEINQDMLSSR